MHDLWLIHRCQRGDEEAFAALYERHHRRVFRTALHLVREPALAEDITQEVFIAVFQEISRLRTPAAFRTWLYRLVVSKASRWLRSNGGDRRPLSLDLMAEQRGHGLAGTGAAGSTAAANAKATVDTADIVALRIALVDLPPDLRLTVLLHYYAGLPVAEVAAVLQVPAGTVKSRLHTARARLAISLDPDTPVQRALLRGAKV